MCSKECELLCVAVYYVVLVSATAGCVCTYDAYVELFTTQFH